MAGRWPSSDAHSRLGADGPDQLARYAEEVVPAIRAEVAGERR